jgi:pimeloyl-ACP methyl ester carboxylesterase
MAQASSATPPRERELVVDGVRTRLLEAGPESASEAVVFVHGNPNSAAEWSDLVSRTGEFARAVALDMPGFGTAEAPSDFAYPVEGYMGFLNSAFEQLGIQRVHLVLHDFGGPWGLGWAITHPDNFASVVLINTGMLIGFEMHRTGRIWGTRVLGELAMALTSRKGFGKSIKQANPRMPDAFIDHMYDEFDRGTRKTVLKLYRNRTDDELLTQVAAAFKALDRPALVLWGGKDVFVPLRHAHQQRDEAFPSAEVVVLEESSHWPFVDDPEGAANAIVPFLRTQVGATAS